MQKSSEDLTMAHEYYREQDYKNCLKVYDILFHKGEQLSMLHWGMHINRLC